jgi:hypothetical protein
MADKKISAQTETQDRSDFLLRGAIPDGAGGFLDRSFNLNRIEPNKNLLINGGFQVWQRGTSFVSPAHNEIISDNWRHGNGGAGGTVGASTDTQEADTPDTNSLFSYRVEVTTAVTTPPAQTESHVRVGVEGYNFSEIFGNDCVLTFWVKSNVVGQFSVVAINRDADLAYGIPYTIDSADTWEKKEIVIPFSQQTDPANWKFDNQQSFRIRFALFADSFYTAPSGWNTGNYVGVDGQTNLYATVGNYLQLSQVKLELGQSSTAFKQEDYATLLKKCQRYIQYIHCHADYEALSGDLAKNFCGHTVSWPEMMDTPTVTETQAPAQIGNVNDYALKTNEICSTGSRFNIRAVAAGRSYCHDVVYELDSSL